MTIEYVDPPGVGDWMRRRAEHQAIQAGRTPDQYVTVHRLEFLQPDGRWCGPYCAEFMTPEAFDIRDRMIAAHTEEDPQRPWPDPQIFAANPGQDRYVCGMTTFLSLGLWFGRAFRELIEQGGHVGKYLVHRNSIASIYLGQVVYMQRMAALVDRFGQEIPPERLVQRVHPDVLRLVF